MKQIENLYREYKQDIYNYLLSLSHNPILSEDLVSETFVKAIYSIGNFNGQSSLKTWLFGIARHLWLQSLRKERNTVEYSDLLGLYITDSIPQNLLMKEIVNRVFELLKTKDEQTQKIIGMRIEGISYYQISEDVGVSENSARVIDFRTKRWLKAALQKEGLL